MGYQQISEQVKQELTGLYEEKKKHPSLAFHNLEHTAAVVANAIRIGSHYQLDEKDSFITETAAWFHDIGYHTGHAEGHEEKGAELAEAFLTAKGVDPETIQSVRRCIMATRMPQSPETLLEKIVCDADLYNLGTEGFTERNKKLRKEIETRTGKKISKEEWRRNTIQFLEGHRYHTDYCRGLLDSRKEANLQQLKQKEAESIALRTLPEPGPAEEQPATGEPLAVKNKKNSLPERGIQTMFRISSSNNQRLSDMADNKAHIMITTTSIIISVLLSVLLRKLEDNPNLVIPTLLLLATCLTTMVLSILATRPALPAGTFTPADVQSKKVNLLFFGNYYKMSYEDYENGMQEVMNSSDYLYSSLTRDVYSQGVVLGRKYRLLRIGYNIFMYGVTISVLAFVIAVIF